MTNLTDDVTPSLPSLQTPIFTRRTNIWIVSTFVFTVLTASALSYTGFLATDPVTAAIDGFLVAIVYVGYRVLNAYRVRGLRSKMNKEE